MKSFLLTCGIFLNILQLFKIGIFIRFFICHHFTMKTFLSLYCLFSTLELIIIGHVYWTRKRKNIH